MQSHFILSCSKVKLQYIYEFLVLNFLSTNAFILQNITAITINKTFIAWNFLSANPSWSLVFHTFWSFQQNFNICWGLTDQSHKILWKEYRCLSEIHHRYKTCVIRLPIINLYNLTFRNVLQYWQHENWNLQWNPL